MKIGGSPKKVTGTAVEPQTTSTPITSTTTKSKTETSTSTVKKQTLQTPDVPTSGGTPKQAGQGGVPSWATPSYFSTIAAKATPKGPPGTKPLQGGSSLNVRLGAMTTKMPAKPTSTTPLIADIPDARRTRAKGLLEKVGHAFGVMAGRPMTEAEIAAAPKALHLTRPEYVDSILTEGLRPTTGLYKNLTTWFRSAVYMFGKEPTPYQKFVNFSTAAGAATAEIEIDLTKLDPSKLYRRVVDDAIIYVSPEPIPASALSVRKSSVTSTVTGQGDAR